MKSSLLVAFLSMFVFIKPAAAFFGGEFNVIGGLGGSEFRSNNLATNNTTAWDFPYTNDASLALNLKLGIRTDFIGLGATGTIGWKEDAFDNSPETMANFLGIKYYDSRSADFYWQYSRVITGGYLQIFIPSMNGKEKMHFYAEYDPQVIAKLHHVENSTTLKKEDQMRGTSFATGLGFGNDKSVFRILYRSTTYTKFIIDDVETELPANGYSTVKTGEMELQFGVQF